MEKVSVLQFRRDAKAIIKKVRQGKRLILTYRGKAVMRLEPIIEETVDPDDCFYSISEIAVPGGGTLTNVEIDKVIYGE